MPYALPLISSAIFPLPPFHAAAADTAQKATLITPDVLPCRYALIILFFDAAC